jgi:Arc/MetJ-type ribon-helix-helix transcriptional regulator
MKVSVSLPAEDVAFLDEYARNEGFESRSAVLHKAVSLLKVGELSSAYTEAWRDWAGSDEAADWETTTSDGLDA